ncbi:MAG TPA: type I 3-dehydroquinate dehydratase [Blastocatellia bacterium]|nr:type I 3-dehydroquinate dehydratase [Blastocatellia bacterium]
MKRISLVGTLTRPPIPWGDEFISLADSVEWLEVRADLTGNLEPEWLRGHFKGNLLYTLRSRERGGRYEGSSEERRGQLIRAAQGYDLVDLESHRDLGSDVINSIPPEKRLISWSGSPADFPELRERALEITATPARLYKLSPTARNASDGLSVLSVLHSINRRDVIAFAAGQAGLWSRLLAPHFGAPFVFGVLGTRRDGLSEPTISQLIEDYGLPSLPHLGALYGIVGSTVSHSLSPRLHNAAYQALGFPGLFVPFQEESFCDFWRGMIQSEQLELLRASIKGLTVASPHKETALDSAASTTSMVRRAGATNIFTRNGKGWRADTTDPQGAVVAMVGRGRQIRREKVAIIGCGGAGRAVAAALDLQRANVTLVNRSPDRGQRAQALLGLPFIPLAEFSADNYSTLVNATPVGRNGDSLPFDVNRMQAGGIVIDLTYGSEVTPLMARALSVGLQAVDGLEVLLIQVLHQFRLMTGLEMPIDLAREKLGIRSTQLVASG